MNYISTRGTAPILGFGAAMMTGLARDGGLYVPDAVPLMPREDIAALAGLPYEAVAFRVMRPYLGGFFSDDEFRRLLDAAYKGFHHDARAPMVQLASNHFLLELFHGPTLAFKDFAMQIIGQMMQAALARTGERITIVGATSGDTGSAAIEAFRGLANVDVFILFPHGRVSDVQRRQMTTPVEANIHALAMDGDFDDCQARVKDMFNDFAFRDGVQLAGVNSINWARLLAQVVYYFAGYFQATSRTPNLGCDSVPPGGAASLDGVPPKVSFTVPTGNFGNLCAGHVARMMGLPIHQLVAATNENDVLDEFFRTGSYRVRRGAETFETSSPSMDISKASNFERFVFDLLGRDAARTRQFFGPALARDGGFTLSAAEFSPVANFGLASGRSTHADRLDSIRSTYQKHGVMIDTHTADGLKVAREHLSAGVPMVVLETALPAKFAATIVEAIGQQPPVPAGLEDLEQRPRRFTVMPADTAEVMQYVQRHCAAPAT